jgi:glutamate-ammonia-ligase adenylyltransferase
MFEETAQLIRPGSLTDDDVERFLVGVGFDDWRGAHARLVGMGADGGSQQALADCLPMLFAALSEAATPDGSLINFERFSQSVPDRAKLFRYLASNPRAVEILIKLFVGSQFLTEILLGSPDYLERLTNHKRLADIKSREQFVAEAKQLTVEAGEIGAKLDALRRYQHWELLRIGACDSFGLLDLKTVTVQLSLLADSLVQSCLTLNAEELEIATEGFAVLAFGKLGGEELNYSSDIDLVFVAEKDATQFWPLGQRLIKALMESTAEGFLYRVDMRLRPWGRSGALVNSVDSHIDYLKQHGMPWEKQALLKARVIAGEMAVGEMFLKQAERLSFSEPVEVVRESVRVMKERIEADLKRQGRKWGEVKSGEGSIRDIEFVTQFLQLSYGGENRSLRSTNTLDALVRLADLGYLQADEYRQLSGGYLFLRTIEHSLQLMHHKQTHTLPEDLHEMAYLARRLDFPDAAQFLKHYHQHCEAIRSIFEHHIGNNPEQSGETAPSPIPAAPPPVPQMEPSYAAVFTREQVAAHARMLSTLSDDKFVEVAAETLDDGTCRVTIVGFDHPGDLSRICGLLFVYGFNIADGQVFTEEQITARHTASPVLSTQGKDAKGGHDVKHGRQRQFVNVYTLHPPLDVLPPEVWERYRQELSELIGLVRAGQAREAQGQLAKRVAGALREMPEEQTSLYPVSVEIDNTVSEHASVLLIRAEDTKGFLYELANSLALSGIDISRVIVQSEGSSVYDTLFVTDGDGKKITDLRRQRELRAAVVLIKHFTHLLPRSPNPEAALLHFGDFLEQLFEQPGWVEELASLERSDVLDALARLLGVSNFLWEDFLRLQHANLFPVVKDVEALAKAKSQAALKAELDTELSATEDPQLRRAALNAFKDREMFRTDMRHILDYTTEFGHFSEELTDVAEAVVAGAFQIVSEQLVARYGEPRLDNTQVCPLSVCALGKCGGRELGFASDIELMFIYLANGRTAGPEAVTTTEFFQKLVEGFMKTIEARREGIFQIDLRLRPYGRAGSLAVTFEAFKSYFVSGGAAWPYERQALVKLRPIAGNAKFGRKIVQSRDELIYTGEPFDVTAMRAMREKQVRQLVQAGSLNAKLSPGCLVDCEYIVQGLQIQHGNLNAALRATNTRAALSALHDSGILSGLDYEALLEAYVYFRRLIDALRMVRGHAKDLTVPAAASEEFEFLARRLGYKRDVVQLQDDLERYSHNVQELSRLLDPPATL